MKSTTVAVDLAKSVFQVAVSYHPGRVAKHLRLSRPRFRKFFVDLEPASVLMEACGSAHYWARELQNLGHSVTLLPPHHTSRYLGGNKTDRSDTKALLEAARNEEIHPVPIKSVDQQTLTFLHRIRSAAVSTRTARLNAIRGLLREFGITIPVGARHVLRRVQPLLDDPMSDLPRPLRDSLRETCDEIRSLDRRVYLLELQLRALARQIPTVGHLMTVPGIGLITATALVAFVGHVNRFPSARHFASYLGLTPREHSSGQIRRLGHISKCGDIYLRTLLVHGARSILWTAKARKKPDPFRAWALEVEGRRGHNIAALAVANKLARFAWKIWKEERTFTQAA